MTEISPPIETLADFPALRQLARALWRQPGERGAAAMIGAGFSLNAQRLGQDVRRPPLWKTLAAAMTEEIYGGGEGAPSDALRLAEEYRTYFGQAALDDFVRDWIPDAGWAPGALHHALVDLPWSDILTTNYDTLIERAAEETLGRTYQVIRTEGDLARFSAPRVFKLHGTVGIDDRFILAEEDYRTYPVLHAAFVNAARQVFVENELCLFGFSGDDPNFLAWSGWVRDHLAGKARRIYLVGVLNLAPAKRRLLEARNISPIDLWPLVEGLDAADRDARALALVMAYLKRVQPVKPSDWLPTPSSSFLGAPQIDDSTRERKDPAFAAARIGVATRVLAQDRRDYPGWLVAPARVRHEFRWQTEPLPYLSEALLKALGPAATAACLREISWRCRVGYLRLDDRTARQIAAVLAAPATHDLSRADRLELACDLARHAREAGDDPALETWVDFVRAGADAGSDVLAEAEYQLCLRARDRTDLSALATALPRVSGPDPAWALRLAGLRCDLGEFELARSVVRDTLKDLRRRVRSAPNSVWLMSRLAWAEWLGRALTQDADLMPQTWSNAYKDWKCDPFDLLDAIGDELQSTARKRRLDAQGVIPDFEPGVYKDPAKTVRFVNAAGSTPLYQIGRLLEEAGSPLRLRHYNLASETFLDALEHEPEDSVEWRLALLRGIKGATDPAFVKHFSRIGVAQMSEATVTGVLDRLFAAVAFWREARRRDRGLKPMEHLPLLTETLGRLALRASPRQALEAFVLAMDMGRDPDLRSHWMMSPIARLARNALWGLPAASRSPLLGELLAFPLPGEVGSDLGRQWPAASEWLDLLDWSDPTGLPDVSSRVEELLDCLAREGADRTEASLRLFRLHDHGRLTTAQARRLGEGLWSQREPDDLGLPKAHGLYMATLIGLPHPEMIDVAARVRDRLYGSGDILDGPDLFNEIFAAATARSRPPLLPDAAPAAHMFDAAVAWRRTSPSDESERLRRAMSGEPEAALASGLGRVLGAALAPALTAEDRTLVRLSALLKFLQAETAPYARVALPFFSQIEGAGEGVGEALRQGLLSDDFHDVAATCEALLTWSRHPELGAPPPALIEHLVIVFESRRPAGLHAVARALRLLLPSSLLDGSAGRLRRTLATLMVQTRYADIVLGSWDAVSVSLLRGACVSLAAMLERRFGPSDETGTWIEAGTSDPMPEVRAAASGGPDPDEAD